VDDLDHLLLEHHQTLEVAHYQNLLQLTPEQEFVSVVVLVLRVLEIVPKSAV